MKVIWKSHKLINFAKIEHLILAFINRLSFNEENIPKVSSDLQMELIYLQTLKIKFDKFHSVPSDCYIINFWRSVPYDNSPDINKICYGTTYWCDHAFSSTKVTENKLRSWLKKDWRLITFEELFAALRHKFNSNYCTLTSTNRLNILCKVSNIYLVFIIINNVVLQCYIYLYEYIFRETNLWIQVWIGAFETESGKKMNS